jgi:hypothetical protein
VASKILSLQVPGYKKPPNKRREMFTKHNWTTKK